MCGIGGVLKRSNESINRQVLIDMLKASSDRGVDSTGVIGIYDNGKTHIVKIKGGVLDLLADTKFDAWLSDLPEYRCILWNNRAQPIPEGDANNRHNRQPIHFEGWWGTHNGTISNDKILAQKFNISAQSDVDTEIALARFSQLYEHYKDKELVQNWSSEMEGGMALAIVSQNDPSKIYIAKNFKPLYVYANVNLIVFASEKKNIVAGMGLESILDLDSKIDWIPPYTGLVIQSHSVDMFPIQTLHRTVLEPLDDKRAVVIASGGIDSSTAAAVASKIHSCTEVTMLHFDYGQLASERELGAVKAVASSLPNVSYENIDLKWMGKLVDTPLVSNDVYLPLGEESAETTQCWVPARNLVMLSVAAAICEARGFGRIYSGFNLEESGSYPDNDIEFLRQFNVVLQYGTLYRPKLIIVLERLMKPEIIRLGTLLGVPFEHTWSCDRGFDKPCGECGCCWTRQFAFAKAGIHDTQIYLKKPENVPVWWGSNFTLNRVPMDAILNKVKDKGV